MLAIGCLAGCGGSGDPKSFAHDASQACRDLKGEIAAIKDDPSGERSIKALQRELDRLRALTPPKAARAQVAAMLRHDREGLDAWRAYIRHARAGDDQAGEAARVRSIKAWVRAAQIAGRLHIPDCDRALS